jgi:hypothetical protein
MNKPLLQEVLSQNQANLIVEAEKTESGNKKFRMEGIFIQGEKSNHNGRNYPRQEISKAVTEVQTKIDSGFSVTGELDHPDSLTINVDRISHVLDKMWMEGSNGMGKLTVLPTPCGDIVAALLGSGVKLGVSSRGSGNVNEATGSVSDFEIITVDIVMQPSAPDAYPTPIYESIFGSRTGKQTLDVFAAKRDGDRTAERYVESQLTEFIKSLKW